MKKRRQVTTRSQHHIINDTFNDFVLNLIETIHDEYNSRFDLEREDVRALKSHLAQVKPQQHVYVDELKKMKAGKITEFTPQSTAWIINIDDLEKIFENFHTKLTFPWEFKRFLVEEFNEFEFFTKAQNAEHDLKLRMSKKKSVLAYEVEGIKDMSQKDLNGKWFEVVKKLPLSTILPESYTKKIEKKYNKEFGISETEQNLKTTKRKQESSDSNPRKKARKIVSVIAAN